MIFDGPSGAPPSGPAPGRGAGDCREADEARADVGDDSNPSVTPIVVARRPFDGFDARWRRRPFARTSARSADRGATFRVRERHRRVFAALRRARRRRDGGGSDASVQSRARAVAGGDRENPRRRTSSRSSPRARSRRGRTRRRGSRGGSRGEAGLGKPRSRRSPRLGHPRSSVLAALTLMASAAVAEALASSPNHAEIRLGLVSAYALLGASNASRDAFLLSTAEHTDGFHGTPRVTRGGGWRGGVVRDASVRSRRSPSRGRRGDIGTSVGRTKTAHVKALEFVSFPSDFATRTRRRRCAAFARAQTSRRASAETDETNGTGGVAPAVAGARRGRGGVRPFPTPPRGCGPHASASGPHNEDLATIRRGIPRTTVARRSPPRIARVRRVVVPAGGLDEDEDDHEPSHRRSRRRRGGRERRGGGGGDPPWRTARVGRARCAAARWNSARRARRRRYRRRGRVRAPTPRSLRRRELVALFAERRPPGRGVRENAAGVGGGGSVNDAILAALASLVGAHRDAG